MSELKPCPLCGSDASLEGGNETLSEGACWWVQCQDTTCFCSIGCHYLSDDGASAIETWNRRAQPAQAGQVLTDEEIDAAYEKARTDYQRSRFAVRGQQLTAQDSPDWWFARAIEQAVLAKRVPMTDPQLQTSEERRATGDRILELIEKQHPGIVGEKGGA